MVSTSPEYSILLVKYEKPGRYVQELLGAPLLNPFLVRVRSRDYYLSPTQVHRQTMVWLHESLFPQRNYIAPTRRVSSGDVLILEQVYVAAATHRDLQLGPREFDKTTRRYQEASEPRPLHKIITPHLPAYHEDAF